MELKKIPNSVLYDMFRSSNEVNFCTWLDGYIESIRDFYTTLSEMMR